MDKKVELIATARAMADSWESFLNGLGQAQLTASGSYAVWSVRDVVAHLNAWQQLSIARLQASLSNGEPQMPGWVQGRDPDLEELTEEFNQRIYQAGCRLSWQASCQDWKNGSLYFLELAEAIPPENLFASGRFPWLKGYPLAAVVEGWVGHHREHLDALLASSQKQANA
jgi:hypothetical protein